MPVPKVVWILKNKRGRYCKDVNQNAVEVVQLLVQR